MDGFPEQFNADKEMIGYARAETLLGEIGAAQPQDVIDRFKAVLSEWKGEFQQSDDVTFVAVRVK